MSQPKDSISCLLKRLICLLLSAHGLAPSPRLTPETISSRAFFHIKGRGGMCNKDRWLLNRDSSLSHNHKKFLSCTHPTHRTVPSPAESIENDWETDHLKPFLSTQGCIFWFLRQLEPWLKTHLSVRDEANNLWIHTTANDVRNLLFFTTPQNDPSFLLVSSFESVRRHILSSDGWSEQDRNWVLVPFYVPESRSGWITWHNIIFNSCFWHDNGLKMGWHISLRCNDMNTPLQRRVLYCIWCTLMMQTPSWIQLGVSSGSLYFHEWWIFHAALWTFQGNTIHVKLVCVCMRAPITHVTDVHALTWLHVSIPLTTETLTVTVSHPPLDNTPDDNPYKTSDTPVAEVITVIKALLHHKVHLRCLQDAPVNTHNQSEYYH